MSFLVGVEIGDDGVAVYAIPGGWMDTAPLEHLAYVNECKQREKTKGGERSWPRLTAGLVSQHPTVRRPPLGKAPPPRLNQRPF